MQPHFSFGFHSKGSEDALADVAMQCGISQAKMAVQSNIIKRGKRKFDDTGILKKSWRWEWTEKVVGGEKISLFLRKILTPGVAYCTLCRREATRLLWLRENKNTLRANLLQRKQSRVSYLASSSKIETHNFENGFVERL